MVSLHGRSFLTLLDYTPQEIEHLLDLSDRVKRERRENRRPQRFRGYTLAMLFEKRSTRTRAAFETAFGEEGGHAVFLSTADIQLGAKETIEDTARVLGRMFDIVEFRGFSHDSVETLAEHSGVPVINGLTDLYHPTQALADIMTIRERFGTLQDVPTVFIGDGRNNVSASLIVAALATGLRHRVICPPELAPDPEFLSRVRDRFSRGSVEVLHDPSAIARDTGAIYTDVWTSMGEESKESERVSILSPYRVTEHLMDRAPEAIFLHCLPAVRGNEMTAGVIDGPRSVVWDQAENRKHTIKAIMLATLGLK